LTAGFNYYNISYRNHYYTEYEELLHKAAIEKTLKQYEDMPLPKVTAIKMYADIFPEKQIVYFNSYVSVKNKTTEPIKKLLLDGDNLSEYSLKYNNKALPFTCPLFFARGKFNFFGPKQDSSGYRLYELIQPLQPGDSALLEINSSRYFNGFTNDLYGANFLYNGTVMGVGLPGLGYDDDEEIRSEEDRKKFGLPKREEDFPKEKEVEGKNFLLSGHTQDLVKFEITVSTSEDQTALAPGNLEKQWKENGRNYYLYTCNTPGIYTPEGILSARYAELHDSVLVEGNRFINIDLYYHPTHSANLNRFVAAYKDGLPYYTSAFGPYPFKQVRLAEASIYAPWTSSMAATDIYSEGFGWNANFNNPIPPDFCYYTTAKQLAKQWWGNQVAPNHTQGAEVISEGIPKYCALMMAEKKIGKNSMRALLADETNWYLWNARWNKANQHPLLNATNWAEKDNKAGIVLYGLKDLIGEENLNSALREFHDAYVFKKEPPYPGATELYGYLKKHVPDSIRYYLTDTWEKITFYENRIIEAKSVRIDSNNHYRVTIKLSTGKVYADDKGNDQPASTMSDYIDIAVFAADTKYKEGMIYKPNLLYLQKHKLSAGEHTIDVIVTGTPVNVGIDPFLKLIDRIPVDNIKSL
jgi:hypothetical protein